jgi:hypothetical protein
MFKQLPPRGTITGAEGETEIAPGVHFTPESAIGDGALHVDGKLAGFIYADARYPYDTKTDRQLPPIWSFTALDPDHREVDSFATQAQAIIVLLDTARTGRNLLPAEDS